MIILDVEIKKAILGRDEEPLPDIEYCGGWRDFAGMGISCVCTYDIVSHLSRVFLEEDLPAFVEYVRNKPTAGFNTKRFDNLLLMEHCRSLLKDGDSFGCPHYDILEQIWLALGLNPDKFVAATHGGWGLDAVCGATLGIHKTGHGAVAPVWWQQGQHGRVIDYCLNDCHMEGQLLLHILQGGLVTNGKESIRVALPRNVRGYGEQQVLSGCAVRAEIQRQEAQFFGDAVPPLMSIDPATDPPAVTVAQPTPSGGLGIIR